MTYMRTIYPKSVPKITGISHKSFSNLYLSNSFKLMQLIQSFTLFCFYESKSYITSHVDEYIFKLLYESSLHQLSSIIASAIGTTLFAHVNLEWIFIPRKSRESTIPFFTVHSVLLHNLAKVFSILVLGPTCAELY